MKSKNRKKTLFISGCKFNYFFNYFYLFLYYYKMDLILTLLLIFAWGFILITKELFYILSLGFYILSFIPIESYLPIIWETIKEDVPCGWKQFFECFRLWQSLMVERKHINFYRGLFFWFLSDARLNGYLGDEQTLELHQ